MKFKYLMFLCYFVMCKEKINAKYEIIADRVEPGFGEKDQTISFDGFRVKKYNRTSFVFNGKYDLKVSFDDEFDVLVEAFNFQSGQYKKIGDKTFPKFCATLYLDKFKEPYNRFYEASSFKVPHKTCPFPAGQNEITNLMFSENGLLPPYLPGGEKWRIDVRFVKKNEILGGLNMYGLLRNERSLLNGG